MIYEEFAHNQRTHIPEPDLANLKLWGCVFAQGLRDFALDQQRVEKGGFPQEPSYWFWTNTNETGSFDWLCDLLKIDASRARIKTLEQLRDLLPGRAIRPADAEDKKD